jgi:hypothetical protein
MLTAERVTEILREFHPYGTDQVPDYDTEGRVIYDALSGEFLGIDGIENVLLEQLFQCSGYDSMEGYEPLARAIYEAMNEAN